MSVTFGGSAIFRLIYYLFSTGNPNSGLRYLSPHCNILLLKTVEVGLQVILPTHIAVGYPVLNRVTGGTFSFTDIAIGAS